jgi:hypothetical protein
MTARIPAAVAAFVCVVASWLPCYGQGKLPAEMARTAYDTGSSGFNIATEVRHRRAPAAVPLPACPITTTTSCNGITLAVANDTGVREGRDLKGKRPGVAAGSPALTQGAPAVKHLITRPACM